jgi:signal transduction histidine kinase
VTSAEIASPPQGSLRLRFLLAILLWVLLGIGGIWISATRVFAAHVELSYHEELEVHVRELARLVQLGVDGMPELSRPLSDPRYDEPLSGFYWQVTSPGLPPLRSNSMTRGTLDESIAHAAEIAHHVEDGPTGPTIAYGMLRQTPDGRDLHLVIATDQSELDQVIASFTREFTLWLIALGAMLLATGIAIIGLGLKPLDRMGIAIARLRRGEAQLLEGRYPSEIAPLVTDLNAYVRQNGEMVDRARVQAGNLAHSLRTPLAVMIDEAEQLAKAAETAGSGQVVLEQAQAMLHQIEFQLARARFSAGVRKRGVACQPRRVLEPILRAMRRLHPERTFTVEAEQCGDHVVPLDPVDLAELLSILLDNAGKWARKEVAIAIGCDGQGGFWFRVADDGPGMTDEQIAGACEIGTRFDLATSGSGLGLAIARDIAASMGAEFVIERGQPGLLVKLRTQGEPSV